jgi:hypothetical protein
VPPLFVTLRDSAPPTSPSHGAPTRDGDASVARVHTVVCKSLGHARKLALETPPATRWVLLFDACIGGGSDPVDALWMEACDGARLRTFALAQRYDPDTHAPIGPVQPWSDDDGACDRATLGSAAPNNGADANAAGVTAAVGSATLEAEPWTGTCPHCGEAFEVLIEPACSMQQFVEDCQVCCRPIDVTVQQTPRGWDVRLGSALG